MKRKISDKSCADKKAKTTPKKHAKSTGKRNAGGAKTKPASKSRKSDGGQIDSGLCLNQAGEEVRPKLRQLSGVKSKPVKWLWKNKIPRGNLSMIVGQASGGKTFWTVNLTAHVTNGTDWADGTPCEEGSVLFFYGEDGLADTYKKRCKANGVNQDRVVFMEGTEVFKGSESAEASVTVADIGVIRQAIQDTTKTTGVPVKVVFIDPITNYLGKVSGNSASGVRSVLHPLQRLAEELDVAFVLIHHFAKGKRTNLQQQVFGTGALVECCRAVWGVFHAVDEDVRYFAPVKFNCGADPTSVLFQIAKPSGKVKVLETDIRKSAEEITDELAAAKKAVAGRPPKALVEVSGWLSDHLSDGGKTAEEIYAAAAAEGFSSRTVDRAKSALGIKSVKHGYGKGSYSAWALPSSKGSQKSEPRKKGAKTRKAR